MRLLTNSPRDIEQAIREPKDEPLRLKSYAAADLPPASDWGFGLIYESDSATIKFSDGSGWKAFQPLDADLSAIAALTTTSFGRSHLTLADAAAGRSLWGLGSAAVKDIGSSGDKVALCNAANTWGAHQTIGDGCLIIFDDAGTDISLGADGAGVALATIFGTFARIDTNGTFKSGVTQVVGPRKTGWSAATGTPTRTSFATGSVTLPQLAERVKALIDDLISHGLIGA